MESEELRKTNTKEERAACTRLCYNLGTQDTDPVWGKTLSQEKKFKKKQMNYFKLLSLIA